MTAPGPTIEIRHGDQRVVVRAGEQLVVGRAPRTDGIAIGDSSVSTRHLVIWFDGAWRVRAEGRNGMFVDGQRIDQVTVAAELTVALARPDGPQVVLMPRAQNDPRSSAQYVLDRGVVTVGRAPDNTVVLSDLLVSRHHARLRSEGQAWWLDDLRSANGTYVDGRRVTAAQRVTSASRIAIGHQTFRLVEGMLVEYQDVGAITFEARDLSVYAGQHRILDNVSFDLEPFSMLVIVGPSGSGKSTLLKALTAAQPATHGQVAYGGRDLYSNYDEIRHRIGFVPQDDILHPQLRVRAALNYAGRLRFPADVTAAQREQRVHEVIAELGLQGQAAQRVSTLSGGQRKRTSTAMELLTRPSLLFLDEPTSGLDINRDREVMTVLRRLANGGRTVVVVSHNVTYLNLADRILVLATGGQLAYYGPPDAALRYFGFTDYADMYAALEQPRNDWRARYEQSPYAAARANRPRAPIVGRSATPTSLSPTKNLRASAQFVTLARRYLSIIAADRPFAALTIFMPLVLALFAHAVPGSQGLSVATTLDERARHVPSHTPAQLLLVLVLGGCLVGSASAVREIVKERAIYVREQSIGLAWSAYLASKVVVLAVIVGIQAIALTLLGVLNNPAPDRGTFTSSGMFEVVLAVVLVTIASMCIGLALSALVSNADRVMPLLVVVIMAQLLMSGAIFPVKGEPVLEQLSWLAPARWGYASVAATTDLARVTGPPRDALWRHSSATVIGDLYALAVLTLLYTAVAAVLVRRVGRVPVRR